MSIETRISKIERAFKVGYKPKLYGTPIIWDDKLEAEWLKRAREANTDLARPILGGLSL